jgi:hypothetical protein
MTYEIKVNEAFKSLEIFFEGKPGKAIREALKVLKFRWNPKKACWYGYADRAEVEKACEGAKVEKAAGTKAPKKAAKVNKYGVKVGDYFSISWGYEQTNVDFFQVIALAGESSVRIREVNPPRIKEETCGGMAADRTYKLDRTKLLEPAPYSVFVKDQINGDLKRLTDRYINRVHFVIGRSEEIAYLETAETTTVYESWYY